MAMAASTMMRSSVTAGSFRENHRPSVAVDAQIRSKITSTDGTVRLPFGSFGSNFFGSTAEFGQGSALQLSEASQSLFFKVFKQFLDRENKTLSPP